MKKNTFLQIVILLLFINIFSKPLFAQKDTIPPVISLLDDSTATLLGVFETFADPGFSITDDQDTITNWDTLGSFYTTFPDGKATKLGHYTVTYRATDKSNNTAEATRYIYVIDTIPPVIKPLINTVNCIFQDPYRSNDYPDYEVTDNYDEEWELIVEGMACTPDSPGAFVGRTYKQWYKVYDRSGNSSYSFPWYIIVKAKGDTSACILQDSCMQSSSVFENTAAPGRTIKLQPNPTSGNVTVTFQAEAEQKLILRLLDVSGRCLQSFNLSKNNDENIHQAQLNTSALPGGIYFVEISGKSFRLYEKLLRW